MALDESDFRVEDLDIDKRLEFENFFELVGNRNAYEFYRDFFHRLSRESEENGYFLTDSDRMQIVSLQFHLNKLFNWDTRTNPPGLLYSDSIVQHRERSPEECELAILGISEASGYFQIPID